MPPQLVAMIRTDVNIEELTVRAFLEERRDHVHHAAKLDLDQTRGLVDALLEAHGE